MTTPESSATAAENAADDVPTAANRQIRAARDAAQLFKHIATAEQEHFYVLGLDAKYRVMVTHCVAIGTADQVTVVNRDVFRELVRHNCVVFIVLHNHPSGDPHPSPSDRELTQGLQLAGALLGIQFLDHLIIAADSFYSISEEALYPFDE